MRSGICVEGFMDGQFVAIAVFVNGQPLADFGVFVD